MTSCYYKALPRIIPELLLLARPESEVVLVSPWIENVWLHPPPFNLNGEERFYRVKVRLDDFLLYLVRDYQIRVIVVVRERDARLEAAVRPLLEAAPEYLDTREVPHLHAKLIVTEAFVLETS